MYYSDKRKAVTFEKHYAGVSKIGMSKEEIRRRIRILEYLSVNFRDR